MGNLIGKFSVPALIIGWFTLAEASLGFCIAADEFRQQQAEDEANQRIDDWVQRLEAATPPNVESEFAAIERDDDSGHKMRDWRTIVMARLINDGIHLELAASYLLDQSDSRDFRPGVSLSQKLLNDLVPVLLDRLESQNSSVFEAGTKWVHRFHSIAAEHSGRIRDLIWKYPDQPNLQVEGCRLLARLAVVTADDRKAIIACLESQNNFVVKNALQSAVAMNSPELLPVMQKNLSHINDDVVIETAAAILKLIGQQPEDTSHHNAAVEALSVLQKRYFNGQQKEVLTAIEKIGRPILLAPDVLRDAIALPAEIHHTGAYTFDMGMHVSASKAIIYCGADSLPLIRTWLSDPETPPFVRNRLLSDLLTIDADQTSIRSVVEQQLQIADDEIQQIAIKLLTKYRDVDARLLEHKIPKEPEDKSLWIEALGVASFESREVAIRLLEPCVLEELPYNRVAAASGLLALGHHSIAIENLPGELIPLLDELGWGMRAELQNVANQLRPSPAGLTDKLLAAATSTKAVDPDETVEFQDEFTVAVRCAELLGALDESAFDARIQLLQHPNGDVRKSVLLQLGESGDPRAVFPIVSHLFDQTTYYVSQGSDVGYDERTRKAAIEALAKPAMDVTSIVPMLCDLLSEDWAAVDAARALSHAKPQSEQILRRIYSVELNDVNARSMAIAATAARLESDESKQFTLLRSQLELLRNRAHAVISPFELTLSNPRIFATLLELHDDGIRLEPLRPDLTYLAIEQPLLEFQTRAEIVVMLAVIDTGDPRWMKMLNQWRSEEKSSFGTVDSLLYQLRKRSPPDLQEP